MSPKLDNKAILALDREFVIHGWGYSDIIITEGHGAKFKDINGKEYIDCLSQTAGVLGVGHTDPRYVKAVTEQLSKISHTLTMFTTESRAILGEKLAKIAPGKMKGNIKTYFANGGSEANETALKFAMMSTGRKGVVGTYNSYHGGTLALTSLMGQPWHREGLPRYPNFHLIPSPYPYRCPFGNMDPDECDVATALALEDAVKHNVGPKDFAAFIIEPIKGNGGHQYPYNKEYWKIIREICDRYNALLIIDEVQTGMGRTGKVWASDLFGIEPDIMTSGKALGGGMPVSAAMIKSDLVPQKFQDEQWHIFTMGGSPITLAGANAAIDIMLEDKLPDKAKRQGERITKRLKEMENNHKLIGEVRGPGLFIGIELVKDKKTKEPAYKESADVFSKALNKGVLFGLSAKAGLGNLLKIKPPLVITDEEADQAVDVFEAALSEVEKS